MQVNWQEIAAPESRDQLRKELEACELLGETPDSKSIYLYRPIQDQGYGSLLKEVGRLREESFRLVGEGTGLSRDVDDYDLYYMHIILWDEISDEVVGAYRLCRTANFFNRPEQPIYTSSLFTYLPEAQTILKAGLELGRSFVQEKYWGSRSLDYLWSGIAAFLRRHPEYRYLLGAVSISNDLSIHAKELIVGFYQRYFSQRVKKAVNETSVVCSQPFVFSEKGEQHVNELFSGLEFKEAFIVLKKQLRYLGYAVPMLYKQYTELTDYGGTTFLGFNIDPNFNDCIDGLVVVDLLYMTEQKKKRYGLEEHQLKLA